MLNMHPSFIQYYEDKKGIFLDNKFDFDSLDVDFSFFDKIESLKSDYLVVAGLTDVQIEIVKHCYPVLLEYLPCFTSEIYVFSKTGNGIEGKQMIKSEDFSFDFPISEESEFIPIKECNLSEICSSRFTKLLLTFDYHCIDPDADYALVLQTSYKGTVADWRCVKPQDFFIKDGEVYRSFLPFRYELLVKDSKRIPHYTVKIFLWNIGKTDKIDPINCNISTFESNRYIYGLVEELQ
jgi:hypothetical protein